MTTFGEIKTWVSKRLQDPNNTTVSSSDVGELVNMAIDFWQSTRFWFNERTDSTVLIAGDNSIPLPSNWLVPSINETFVIEYSGIRYPLIRVSESAYNSLYLVNGLGLPRWFSKQANAGYKLYPIPDQDYILNRYYLVDYEDLVNDSDTNDFLTYASGLIKYQAAAYGMRDLRQQSDMFATFSSQVDSELMQLLRTTNKSNATGRLTITSFLL